MKTGIMTSSDEMISAPSVPRFLMGSVVMAVGVIIPLMYMVSRWKAMRVQMNKLGNL